MNEICKHCKYWKETNSFPVKDTKLGKCKKVQMFWDCTEWYDDDAEYDYGARRLVDEHKNDKAFVQDGSDYVAYLITKEEFGCNQFES